MKVINLQTYGVVVIRTDLTKEAILKLQRHVPQALKLSTYTNLNEVSDLFAISFGTPSINEYGISFNKVDDKGRALITIAESLSNEEVAEKYVSILRYLNVVEQQAKDAYKSLEEDLMAVVEAIATPTEIEDEEEANEVEVADNMTTPEEEVEE